MSNEEFDDLVREFAAVPSWDDETLLNARLFGNSVRYFKCMAKISSLMGGSTAAYSCRTLGDLRRVVVGQGLRRVHEETVKGYVGNGNHRQEIGSPPLGIGIDIEEVKAMPVVDDYRTDEFYTAMFSQEEISYAIASANQRVTFAGMFAAKEAIRKASHAYAAMPMSQIEIRHDEHGAPIVKGFVLSIAHTEELAIAVALHYEQL